ncbi:MAG TPA: dipeptide epimerase [Oligoflexus sp.]|uniref:dipeptide epimerase n=1 Tax=Oligoflexus sp. TaxID=1971216 RepID=UPI002D7F15B4|nr:dipeptide epimerase [Oligoflexus sp.]HET9239684.1 dipeptide epimerase [Oligoflexus sp.]
MSAEHPVKAAVVSSTLYPMNIPIHVPFTISRESLPTAEIILVEIHSEHGLVGLGECAPFPSLTGDTMKSAAEVARGLLDEIHGCTTQKGFERLRKLKTEVITQSITAYVGVEGALWDLHARELGRPLTQLWGAGRQTQLETDITLPIMDPHAVQGFWDIYQSYGFGLIKIKVSGHVQDDLDMILELKHVAPAGMRFILDGNQGFTVANAEALVSRLKAIDVHPLFFEQPLPEDDVPGFVRLAQKLPIPICVDETVRSHKDLQRLLELGLKPIVNIKIMKSGIEDSLRIIALAQRAGCPLMIGGMLESEVAMGLSLQIACATEAVTYADLDTPFFFKERVCEDSPWHPCRAQLQLPPGVGHGLTRRV